jgi:hypothetical protein
MCSSQDVSSLLRLRVVADADPGAIVRVLERFQALNVVPRRVVAEFGIGDIIHIEVDVFGLPKTQMDLVAAKLRESVSVTRAYWHPL